MPPDPNHANPEPRVFFYGESAQLAILRATLSSLGANAVGCGSVEPAASSELSQALEVDREDDLRRVVQRDDFDILLIGSSLFPDGDMFSAIRSCQTPVVTLQPLPCSFEHLIGNGTARSPATVVAPLFRHAPGVKIAQSFLADFGPARTVNIAVRFDPCAWSLFSRLYDTLDMVGSLIGDCDQIHAAVSGANGRATDTLRSISGDMTVHVCGSDQQSAVISLHGTPGTWFRGMTINGPSGYLRVTDWRCEHADEQEDVIRAPEFPVVDQIGMLIAADIRTVLDLVSTPPLHNAHAHTLALCEAALVSCRTGGSESILRFLEMIGSA